VCPIWPGQPVTAHWGVPDPASVQGPDAQRRGAFQSVWAMLRQRVEQLLALPLETLDRAALQQALRAIGRAESA
jgi:arsenate reductase